MVLSTLIVTYENLNEHNTITKRKCQKQNGKFSYTNNYKSTIFKAYHKKTVRTHFAVCVGVLAAEPFLPSIVARCCSKASNKELGALVRSGRSPLSMPTFLK